ncbi:MAG: hypothetical protein Q8K70_01720 [Bacteroidota bacterium]|nr:hypothetical protein [Bacteroidota bacterium]
MIIKAEVNSNQPVVMVVLDENNETISGAKLRIENTTYEFYSNINGECLIPSELIHHGSIVIIESISYKTQRIDIKSNYLKINLVNR